MAMLPLTCYPVLALSPSDLSTTAMEAGCRWKITVAGSDVTLSSYTNPPKIRTAKLPAGRVFVSVTSVDSFTFGNICKPFWALGDKAYSITTRDLSSDDNLDVHIDQWQLRGDEYVNTRSLSLLNILLGNAPLIAIGRPAISGFYLRGDGRPRMVFGWASSTGSPRNYTAYDIALDSFSVSHATTLAPAPTQFSTVVACWTNSVPYGGGRIYCEYGDGVPLPIHIFGAFIPPLNFETSFSRIEDNPYARAQISAFPALSSPTFSVRTASDINISADGSAIDFSNPDSPLVLFNNAIGVQLRLSTLGPVNIGGVLIDPAPGNSADLWTDGASVGIVLTASGFKSLWIAGARPQPGQYTYNHGWSYPLISNG